MKLPLSLLYTLPHPQPSSSSSALQPWDYPWEPHTHPWEPLYLLPLARPLLYTFSLVQFKTDAQ
jgi:hypothetical protein